MSELSENAKLGKKMLDNYRRKCADELLKARPGLPKDQRELALDAAVGGFIDGFLHREKIEDIKKEGVK